MKHENSDYYKINVQIIIISGGLGTRLRHRTGDLTPKALLKIGGKTLLDYCIEKFSKKRIFGICFSVGKWQ